VAEFPGGFKHHAVGKTQRRMSAKEIEGRYDYIGVLQSKILLVQKHFDAADLPIGAQFVDPDCHHDRKWRYPNAVFDEMVGDSGLMRVVSNSLTTTLVSAARMALQNVLPLPLIHLFDGVRFRRPVREQRPVYIVACKLGVPDDDLAVVFVPLQNGSWAKAKLSANGCGNRNPPLFPQF
jgi:hypothetical protein